MSANEGTTLAPEGQVWVCNACGKTSRTKYGFDENNRRVSQIGYDASCMMNSVLCYEKKPEEKQYRAVEIKDGQ